jgi:hypothetical protein
VAAFHWETRLYTRVYPKVSGLAALQRELQMVQLSATGCSYIAILWVSLVSFVAITLCVASQWVFIVVSVYFVIDSVRKLLDTPSYKVSIQECRCFKLKCLLGPIKWGIRGIILVRVPLGKRPLWTSKRSWRDNIKMAVREADCENGRWMEFAEDRTQWQADVATFRMSEIVNKHGVTLGFGLLVYAL